MKLVKWRDVDAQNVEVEGAVNTKIRVLVGPETGAPNFVMRLFDIGPEGSTPYHVHDWEHEMFVVSGRGVCVTEDGETPLEPEDAVFMPGGRKHCFRSTGDEVLRVICLIPVQDKCG
jgi:quercetin dioxygenase-like cupin family protein